MVISPSQVQKGQTCMKQVFLHYKLGIRPKITSANLAFGKAVDSTVMDYLGAISTGTALPAMEDVFMRHWKQNTSIALEYSTTQSREKMEAMGTKLAVAFPGAWEESGLMVFTMPNGTPALQVKLAVKISPKATLRGYLDLIALNQDGKVVIIDIKTTGVAYDEIYTIQSDQLTAYQILVDAHARRLGVTGADEVGFMCLHKKVNPEIHQPQIVSRRDNDRVQEYLNTCQWYVDDFNKGRFNRCSLGAFNSPCNLCDFRNLCAKGETDDLIIPDLAKATLKLAA